jgi:delta 1-pyrroline-5-carboxylate dehydrogenase
MTVQTLASTTAAAKPYEDFDRLPIGGSWREGRSDKVLPDRNPYTGSVLVQIRQGNREDLDTAFETAAEAHKDWAARLPSPRAEAIRRAAAIFQARRGEVVSWLIREVGSIRLKANLEWASSHAIMAWSAGAPDLVEGKNLPTDIRGNEGQVHRKPVCVVGVISSWKLAVAPLQPLRSAGPGGRQCRRGKALQRHADYRRAAAGEDLQRGRAYLPASSASRSDPARPSAAGSLPIRCRA